MNKRIILFSVFLLSGYLHTQASVVWKSPDSYISAIYLTSSYFQFGLRGESNFYRITETDVGSQQYERLVSEYTTAFFKGRAVSFTYESVKISLGGTMFYKLIGDFYSSF